ncbi:LysM peptidoglycan-binding domain-containing protein [Dyella sp. LX-66]|uniref:LysM peptidoglycan-binding domain-containing protein n=1 Tax=unclassified Dyella TaxID=2634549 RepID=UPI001BE0C08D|nr:MULTISPECIES: LysM domain-containing protein [unclassified Dyella]MBT2116219.1 LysM peptidoglycan-binding domain-containing protein [Dyella sp. LX-1]MBT2138229.1 LysM peptidoglycan-binding domain-containing protein [Dyella sp. LX-66]
MNIIPADASTSYAQPQLPPPATYTATGKETVTQVAQQFNLAPEELASINRISVDSTLSAGQVLTLPAHAAATAQAAPAAQTPAQKTDAAIAAYQAAVKQHDDAMHDAPRNGALRGDIDRTEQDKVNTAKQAMDQAIGDEIAGEVAFRNQNTPPDFRAPADQQIASAGAAIIARHPGDAALATTLQASVDACKLRSQANALIPDFSGDWSAADKLKHIALDGQPQDVVDAVAADPRVQAWAKQAAGQIDQAYAGGKNGSGSLDAAHALLDSIQGLPPPLAAEVVRQSLPTIQKMGQMSMNGDGEQTFGTMQRVISALGTGPDAQDLASQVAGAYLHQAEDWSQRTVDSVTTAMNGGVRPTLAMALANALQNDGKTDQAQDITVAATVGQQNYLANVPGSPLKAYNDAHGAKLEKDEHLAELLNHAGPLNDQQKQAFIKAYRADPDNAKVYQAETDAGRTLASYMSAHQDELVAAAGRSPDNAKQLYDSIEDLNQSGQGKTALAFVVAIDADPAATKAFNQFSDYQSKVVNDSIAAAQAQLLVEGHGDAKGAATQLLALAAPLFQANDGWSQLTTNYTRMAENKEDAFTAKVLGEEFKELGPGGKGLAMASIMVNAINGDLGDNISGVINSYSTAGGTTVGLASGALQSLVDAEKAGSKTASLAEFSARLVPGLSLIAATSACKSDFDSMQNNPVYAGAVIGDLFSVIGSTLEVGGVEVPGAFINAIGSLVAAPFQFAGGIIDDITDANQIHADVRKYLGADGVNLKPSDIDMMANADPGQVNQWLGTGISPDELQDLARIVPNILQSNHSGGPAISSLQDAGLSGQDVYDMLKAADAQAPCVGAAELMRVLSNPHAFDIGGARNKATLADDLRAIAQQERNNTAGDPAENLRTANAAQTASDWLELHITA